MVKAYKIEIQTFIEIISSGQPCIADVNQDSKPLEKFLMACVNVPINNQLIHCLHLYTI